MGLCASKPERAAAPAAAAALGAAAGPAAASQPPPRATEEELAEARDTAGPLGGAPFAAANSPLDPAPSLSSPSLLRKEQSVVGALPVFQKTSSKASSRGVPISDLPPPTTRAITPPPQAPVNCGNSGADASPGDGRRSKGYDPLERPSRSALRTPGNAGDDGTEDTAASGGGPAVAAVAAAAAAATTATAAAAAAAAAAGPSSSSRKSLDGSSVKFRGLPGQEEGGSGGAGASTAAGSLAGQATATNSASGSQRSLARVTIDAEDADPETAARRALLDSYSKTFSMRAVVDRFYERVWADPLLRPFFERVDQEKLKRHQEAAFALAFGGRELLVTLEGAPGGAPPSDLRAIHRKQIAKHGLGLQHFDAFVEHFRETIAAIPAIPEDQRVTALAQLSGTKHLFEPLTAEERLVLEREEAEEEEKRGKGEEGGKRPSGGGGGRRRFLLFGRRTGQPKKSGDEVVGGGAKAT
jgi:hemoglobin